MTLFATWAFGIAPANFKTLGNVAIIVVGVVIASFGEIKFDMLGFLIQCGGIIFEALRLVMVQRLLSSAEFKMDPLVSLYYYAPACAITNGIVTLFTDVPRMTMNDIYSLGIMTLIANALVAFLLNASVVLLVRFPIRPPPASSLMNTLADCPLDWQDFCRRPDHGWYPQGYPPGLRLDDDLPRPRHRSAVLRLLHCPGWPCLLQAGC